MMLTIHTLFTDPNIVNASVIQRASSHQQDTIYWQQYLGFRSDHYSCM